ncbi:hypothetical protein [Clavibacter michiganensis]|uniref:hypothetical protein n=1 Tax=Clavibacter michiganensis TaxID=28447 RepID=UPI0005B95CE2|nr:hypothetical protein [Clavibacter michiganensis]
MGDGVEEVLLVVTVVGLVGLMISFIRMAAHGMVDNRRPTRPMILMGFTCAVLGWGSMLIRLALF